MKQFNTILMVLACLFVATQAAATGGHKPKPSCNSDSYSTEILKEEKISETCTAYELKVSYNGTRTYGLSHYSIAIPCGEVKNLKNSKNWKMVFGKDRTTGVYGLKVDDIHGFGERKADSFTIKFTWCSAKTCTKELGIVAYKFGKCVSYDTLSNHEDPDTTQTCSTLLASLQKKNVTCSAGSDGQLQVAIQDGQAPFVYSWSNGLSTGTAQNLPVGSYAVTIRDANGNTLTLNEQITGPPPIVITETVINPSCSGLGNGSIALTTTGGNGGYTYAWSTGLSDQNLTDLISGLYTVTVSDSTGCSAQKTFMLTNTSLLTVESLLLNPSCTQNNGSINITPAGGVAPYTYRWNNGSTTEDVQNLGAGTFRVKVTDAIGCSVDKVYALTINNTLTVTSTVTPTSCLGDTSGAIDLSVFGGTAPYTIQWLDGPTTEDRSGLAVGNYSVTVTDASGCSRPTSISINKKPLQVTSVINQPTCSGDLGSITVTPTGVPPYTYNWSNGETDNSIEGLVAGTYSVTITDASGCTRTLFFGITAPTALAITSAINNAQCGTEGAFAIDLSVMGGQFPYTYLWSTGATTQDISGLTSGTYSVDIKDTRGCVVKKQFSVSAVSLNWSCIINAPTAPVVCKSVGNLISTGVANATSYQWTVSSTDNSWAISAGAKDSAVVYTAGNPASSATFTLSVVKNGCTQTCSYTVTGGCIVRDNTGGGDPSSSDPCTTPTTPPVVIPPEPGDDEPTHGCKSKIISVYPNPFKDKVKLDWKASTNDNIRLEIFDSHGNRLTVLYQGAVKAGQHYSFEWSAIGCGKDRYYYYRYTSSKTVDYGKLIRK